MQITEQPGRYFAILFLGPYLIYTGKKYHDKILFYIGILFIIYELFWIIYYKPKTILL